jgi:hypothetical protein
MTEIVDLNAEREKRDRPDPQFVKKDDFGREMYLFALEYEMDGKTWGIEVWAYAASDAEFRVEAMRESLVLRGQIMGTEPA